MNYHVQRCRKYYTNNNNNGNKKQKQLNNFNNKISLNLNKIDKYYKIHVRLVA